MNLLLGADPEVFIKQDDCFISAHGMIEGNKKHPMPVRNGAVQVDGMALEFNIDPSSTEEEFLYNVRDVMGQLKAMVPEFEVVATPVAHFGKRYIEEQPYEAKRLGCDPDYNAWTGEENIKPDEDLPFRTGAGHVHFGWTEGEDIKEFDFISMVKEAVKQLDFYLGLPSLLFDGDVKRREMYGRAGAYRPKPYGCEYRTLSNKWIGSEDTMRLVYRNSVEAFNNLMKGNLLSTKYEDIEDVINTSDINRAIDIMKKENITYAL